MKKLERVVIFQVEIYVLILEAFINYKMFIASIQTSHPKIKKSCQVFFV